MTIVNAKKMLLKPDVLAAIYRTLAKSALNC
jgi:hypothetical protein